MKNVTINSQKFVFSENTLSIPLEDLTKNIKVVDAYLNLKIVQTESLPTRFDIDFKPNESDRWNVDSIEASNDVDILTLNLSDEVQYCLDNNYSQITLLFKTLTGEHLQLEDSELNIDYISLSEFQANGSSHNIDLGKAGSASIDLATQQVALSVPLVSSDNNVLPLSIAAHYNSVKNELMPTTGLPDNWGLNVQQFLIKDDSTNRLRFTYIDGNGKNQLIEEKYYYIENKEKHFLEYGQLSVSPNGDLMYENKKVHTILEAPSGLKLVASIKDIDGSKLVDYEPEEVINVRQQIKQLDRNKEDIENSLKSSKKQFCLYVLTKNALQQQFNSQKESVQNESNMLAFQRKIEIIRKICSENNRLYRLQTGSDNSTAKDLVGKNPLTYSQILKVYDNCLKHGSSAPGGGGFGGSSGGGGGGGGVGGRAAGSYTISEDQVILGSIISNESSFIYSLGFWDSENPDPFKSTLDSQEEAYLLNKNLYYTDIEEQTFKETIGKELSRLGIEISDLGSIYKSFKYPETFSNNENEIKNAFILSLKDIISIDLQLESLAKSINKNNKLLTECNEQLEKYQNQLNLLEIQSPIHYLYNDENVIYGFGKAKIDNNNLFRLILIADPYENTIFIKYKDFDSNTIESITDSADKTILFNYNNDYSVLESIIDSKDRIVKFATPNDKLFQITHTNDSKSNYFLTNKDKQLVVDQSGFGVIINKSLIPSESGNVVDLNIENFSIITEIKNGDIEYQNSLTFDDFADENVILAEKKNTGKTTYIRKNNLRSTTITSNNKSITYIFDNLGKVRTMYENNFKQNSEDNCSRATEFNYHNNKTSAKISQLPYSENLLSDECFKEPRTIKHALYLGNTYCGADTIPYSYKICEKFHSLDDNSINKFEQVYMSKKMKNKINLSYKDCNHKAYMLSGWAKANSAYIAEKENIEDKTPTTYLEKRKFELRIEVTYLNDNEPQIEKKSFDWRNTDWQFCSVPIYINSDKIVSEVKCIIDYSNNTGKIEFTDLEFKEADFEESIYDEQTRLVEKSNAHSQWVTKFEYEDDSTRISKELIYKKSEINKSGAEPLEIVYEYNKQGSLIRTTNCDGIVNENTYNEQGLVVKSITYNKDEPSSKFYQESCLDEKGKSTKELNELGFDGAKLEYIEGTGIITSKTYEDGTKISYGYTPDNNLLEISSTINGIENTNTYGYYLDTLTSLKHNDFSVDYDYNSDGDISRISIANNEYLVKEYIDEPIEDDTTSSNKTIKNEITKFANQETFRQTLNDDGNVVETYFTPKPTDEDPSPAERLVSQNIYDTYGNLVFVKELIYNQDGTAEEKISKIFIDKFGNTYKEETKQHGKKVLVENCYDDEHSNVENSTITIEDEELFYNYNYSNEVKPKLKGVLLPNEIEQIIKYDKLGRVKQIESGNINKEYNYLKSGDHSSNLISNIKFSSKSEANENMHYSYDSKGNITEVRINNELIARYQYDGLSRIIREDNKKIGKTSVYSYDAGDNITQRLEYPFTLTGNLDTIESTPFVYSYPTSGWRDQLIMLNGRKFEYDELGNPTRYKDLKLDWSNGRQLDAFDVLKDENNKIIGQLVDYKYNANGIRTSKTIYTDHPRFKFNGANCECTEDCLCEKPFTTQFFLNGEKIIKQHDCCNDLTFYYGADDITGFHLKNNIVDADFFYKKNLQNDIIGIYDSNGKQIVRYTYDAWGNVKTEYLAKNIKENGEIIEEYVVFHDAFKYNDISEINAFIAFKNPFRYRGYYYDFETNLYYLNSRYYDPEICRFINADDISNLDAESLNGLNLYAYCGNNPIYFTDPFGTTKWWEWLLAGFIVVGLVVGSIFTGGLVGAAFVGAAIGAGVSLGSQAIFNGELNWGQFALDIGVGAITGLLGVSGISKIGSMLIGAGIGGISNFASQLIGGASLSEINWISFGISVVVGGVSGLIAGAGTQNAKAVGSAHNVQKAAMSLKAVQNRIASGTYYATAQGMKSALTQVTNKMTAAVGQQMFKMFTGAMITYGSFTFLNNIINWALNKFNIK